MGQVLRVFAAGYPHDITERGHRLQQTFFCLKATSPSATLKKCWAGYAEGKSRGKEERELRIIKYCAALTPVDKYKL